jgi:hypothetical protein
MSAYSDLRLDVTPTALRPSILIWVAQSRTYKNARRASANLAAQYATRPATRCWIRDDRGLQGNPPGAATYRVAPTAARLQQGPRAAHSAVCQVLFAALRLALLLLGVGQLLDPVRLLAIDPTPPSP